MALVAFPHPFAQLPHTRHQSFDRIRLGKRARKILPEQKQVRQLCQRPDLLHRRRRRSAHRTGKRLRRTLQRIDSLLQGRRGLPDRLQRGCIRPYLMRLCLIRSAQFHCAQRVMRQVSRFLRRLCQGGGKCAAPVCFSGGQARAERLVKQNPLLLRHPDRRFILAALHHLQHGAAAGSDLRQRCRVFHERLLKGCCLLILPFICAGSLIRLRSAGENRSLGPRRALVAVLRFQFSDQTVQSQLLQQHLHLLQRLLPLRDQQHTAVVRERSRDQRCQYPRLLLLRPARRKIQPAGSCSERMPLPGFKAHRQEHTFLRHLSGTPPEILRRTGRHPAVCQRRDQAVSMQIGKMRIQIRGTKIRGVWQCAQICAVRHLPLLHIQDCSADFVEQCAHRIGI